MNRIKELRQAFGYTQAELGKLLNCTGMTISRYENGRNDIDTVTINRLCEIFRCTSDYLLGFSAEPETQLPRGEQLDSELYHMLADLNPDEVPIAKAFIAGLKASRKN